MSALAITAATYSIVGALAGSVAFAVVCVLIRSGYRRPTCSEFISMMSIPFIVGIAWPYWAYRAVTY